MVHLVVQEEGREGELVVRETNQSRRPGGCARRGGDWYESLEMRRDGPCSIRKGERVGY